MLLMMLEPRASRAYQLWHQQFKYFFQQFPFPLLNRDLVFRLATENAAHTISVSLIPYALGAWGLVWHGLRDWRRFAALLAIFLIMGFGLSFYLNMQDPQPRERHYVFGGMFFAFAIWMGLGWTGIVELARQRWRVARPVLAGIGLLRPAASARHRRQQLPRPGPHRRLHRLRLRLQPAQQLRGGRAPVHQRRQRHLPAVVPPGGRGDPPGHPRRQPEPPQHRVVHQAAARPRAQGRHPHRRHLHRLGSHRHPAGRHVQAGVARTEDPARILRPRPRRQGHPPCPRTTFCGFRTS